MERDVPVPRLLHAVLRRLPVQLCQT